MGRQLIGLIAVVSLSLCLQTSGLVEAGPSAMGQAISQGLGLTEAQLTAIYGTPQDDIMGKAYAVGNGTLIADTLLGDPVGAIERSFTVGVSYDEAVLVSTMLMPTDAVAQGQYVSRADIVVDVYSSEWLKGQFPNPDDWINAEPGTFIVEYGSYNPMLGNTEVTRMILSIGNNP